MRLVMRCLLLLLLLAILSLLAALFVRGKSGREVATENNFRIQLMDSAITKKPPKRERKKEPWIRVVKRADLVKQMCKAIVVTVTLIRVKILHPKASN